MLTEDLESLDHERLESWRVSVQTSLCSHLCASSGLDRANIIFSVCEQTVLTKVAISIACNRLYNYLFSMNLCLKFDFFFRCWCAPRHGER